MIQGLVQLFIFRRSASCFSSSPCHSSRARCWVCWQRCFALGVAAHGIDTARAFSVNAEAWAYANLGMGLHGMAGAPLISYGVAWWF